MDGKLYIDIYRVVDIDMYYFDEIVCRCFSMLGTLAEVKELLIQKLRAEGFHHDVA